MRDRAWRRATYEKVTLRRLKMCARRSWWYYQDINGYYVQDALFFDYIGTEYHHNKRYYGKYNKDKYSPNRSNRRGNYPRPGNTPDTREWNKRYLLKTLKENGIK
jgi:hypothetical protein